MLPINAALPQLLAALDRCGVAVLQAPPGAGKTTCIPPALLQVPWLAGRKILMLEPRRVAARSAARYMARQLGEPVGETVGYRVRRDTRVGPRTRIEIVTEGVLTRMLHSDPSLDEAAIVIFDEFHERSLHADLGLALTLQTRAVLRDDLRVLVMSATLDGAAVAALIGTDRPAPVITSEGRAFPVDTRHVPLRGEQLERRVAAVVRQALEDHEGDALVFLPGAGEIARVGHALEDAALPPGTCVVPLHAGVDADAQDRAIAPSPRGERKVVLATTIAQTSLTIEGVRIVIDSGYVRTPRFSPRSGMTRLETVRVSRATAEQRRGRAGRVAPGVCVRLWDANEELGLVPFDRPEILEADLAPLALELAAAGIVDAADLCWLDSPPAAALAQARDLLEQLHGIDAHGRITPHGRTMVELGAHPRMAHLLIHARESGPAAVRVAADLAALLGQRDVLRQLRDGVGIDIDLRLRLEVVHAARQNRCPDHVDGAPVDKAAVQQALAESREWQRALGVRAESTAYDVDAAGVLVGLAYPERIAQRRPGVTTSDARYVLRNGTGAVVTGPQSITRSPYLAIAEIGGSATRPRVYSAAPLALADLESLFRDAIQREQAVEWDSTSRSVRARERERLGAIVIREGPLRSPERAALYAALLDGIRRDGLEVLPWTHAARRLRERMAFAHAVDPSWPDVSDAALIQGLEMWLGTAIGDSGGTLDRIELAHALLSALPWDRRQELDRFAPTHLKVPSGSMVRIDYASPSTPVLAVRLQEVFGLQDTPRIAFGRVPLTVHLLSPAQRTVQVTQDLAGFWRTSYFEVKKEMKGRYPRHHWPDDPLCAAPRRGTRK